MKQLIECVPNFSEGRNQATLNAIRQAIAAVEGVKVLEVDPGKDTNRTVFTFVGEPESVINGAFEGIKAAKDLIDMRVHSGEHPRFGACDVCPLIPISGISMEETVQWAKKLGEQVGSELEIPVYLYELAASAPHRKNLAEIRSGEYEGIPEKISQAKWKPDYGPAEFQAKTGNIAIGARNFLIAYNVNLNTTSTRRANNIAFDVREQGRFKTEDGKPWGKKILDEDGNPIREAGTCKGVKAIGWYIEEYGLAQVSMNITDLKASPIHKVFEANYDSAYARGMRVTGSELVGLIPLQSMLDAGKYFLQKQERSIGVSEAELIHIAVKTMGLDELRPFDPKQKIIEYALKEDQQSKLVDLSVQNFLYETASESPAPGGGSVSALAAAQGISLVTMVANLSSHKRGWDHKWEFFSKLAEQGQQKLTNFISLIDADTDAFNAIMDAFSLPKSTEEEQSNRKQAILDATIQAIKIPGKVIEEVQSCIPIIEQIAQEGNPNSISDVAVGILQLQTGSNGAFYNVEINTKGFEDNNQINKLLNTFKNINKDNQMHLNHILTTIRS